MEISPSVLATMAGAIAVAAGLPVDSVLLYENHDGSFTASVFGSQYTGSLTDVLTWAAQEAREAADKDFVNADQPDTPGMSL